MQSASPIFDSSAETCCSPDGVVGRREEPFEPSNPAVSQQDEINSAHSGGTAHRHVHTAVRAPRPPASSRPATAPHPVSLKTSARSVAMVQRVLRGLNSCDSCDSNNEPSASRFVQEGLALQQGILEEVRARCGAVEQMRLSQAATSLEWSRRSDDVLDNLAVLESVANEISKKAEARVAELKGRQEENEIELAKVKKKAERDLKLLLERTAAQIEIMRLATQTVVR
jgi:hypothetical protein